MKLLLTLLCWALFFVACSSTGADSQSNNAKQERIPLTYEESFQQAYGPVVSSVPDTLALGYYWGMTKAQTAVHVKALARSEKVQYKTYKGYIYKMPLTHYSTSGNLTDDYSIRLSTEYFQDTLKVLNLWLKGSDNSKRGTSYIGGNRDLTMEDLYKEFCPIFNAKGYICKSVNPGETMDTDAKHGLPLAHWKGIEYRFVKDNTLIRLWRGDKWYEDYYISYYDMSVVFKEQQDIAAKEAAKAKKVAEENAAREEQKKEYLLDF